MNFNRFEYLYNFKNKSKDESKPQNEIATSKIITPEVFVQENELIEYNKETNKRCDVTVNQIINNPCIFKIREKLMSNKIPEDYILSETHSKINHSQIKENKSIRNSQHIHSNSFNGNIFLEYLIIFIYKQTS